MNSLKKAKAIIEHSGIDQKLTVASKQVEGADVYDTNTQTTLDDLVEYFKEDGATHKLADSIDTLLINWLVKHICVVDREFGSFLKDKGIEIT